MCQHLLDHPKKTEKSRIFGPPFQTFYSWRNNLLKVRAHCAPPHTIRVNWLSRTLDSSEWKAMKKVFNSTNGMTKYFCASQSDFRSFPDGMMLHLGVDEGWVGRVLTLISVSTMLLSSICPVMYHRHHLSQHSITWDRCLKNAWMNKQYHMHLLTREGDLHFEQDLLIFKC